MKGKLSFSIQNRHITFKFELERNITVITGDSGTGKTKLINMVRMYSELGKTSGITLRCSKPCIVLSGINWETVLENTHESIVFVEESTSFLSSKAFASAIQSTDNYYVLVTREPLPQIPYSIDAIKQIIKNERKPKISKIFNGISVKTISDFPYEEVIVEDSKAGYQFYYKASEKKGVICQSARGKSNLLSDLNNSKANRILLIADAAALGSEIKELMKFKQLSNKTIDFFLPESFEWLVLKSAIFNTNAKVKSVLSNPVNFIESKDYFSWERFFTHLLVEETKDNPKQLRYPKSKNTLPIGYLSEANMDSILNAMKNK